MKSTTFLFFIVLLLGFSLNTMQGYIAQEDDKDFLYACCMPLDFNQPRIIHGFLKRILSDKRYAYEYFPYNINSHLMQFLDHGKAVKHNATYTESSLRLFYNCMKRAPFVCNKAFSELLDKAPQLLNNISKNNNTYSFFDTIEQKMMGVFVPTFLHQFPLFKANPEEFFKSLSHELRMMIESTFNAQDHIAHEQMKQMFVRFVELGLLKLMWDPYNYDELWSSVKHISLQLEQVAQMGLITIDELDDCYKSLLESFYRFVDLNGAEFPMALIETIKEDLASQKLLLFELEEQEASLESKRERMIGVLIDLEAQIEARKRGII